MLAVLFSLTPRYELREDRLLYCFNHEDDCDYPDRLLWKAPFRLGNPSD